MALTSKLLIKNRDVKMKNVIAFYSGLERDKISIGVFGSTDTPGINNAKKALWNEFGTTQILTKNTKKRLSDGSYITLKAGTKIITPPRPFARLYLYPEVVKNIADYLKQSVDRNFMGGLKAPKRNAKNVLQQTADFGAEQMRKIADEIGVYEPNAPLTVAIKGFDKPLFKTGRMIDSIKGKVKKRI